MFEDREITFVSKDLGARGGSCWGRDFLALWVNNKCGVCIRYSTGHKIINSRTKIANFNSIMLQVLPLMYTNKGSKGFPSRRGDSGNFLIQRKANLRHKPEWTSIFDHHFISWILQVYDVFSGDPFCRRSGPFVGHLIDSIFSSGLSASFSIWSTYYYNFETAYQFHSQFSCKAYTRFSSLHQAFPNYLLCVSIRIYERGVKIIKILRYSLCNLNQREVFRKKWWVFIQGSGICL